MTRPAEPATRTPWPSSRTVLASVAVIFLLYFGHAFFIPIAVALLFNILFRPVVRWLERRRISAPIGATIVVLLALAGLGAAGMALSVPVKTWVAKAPESVNAARERLARFRKPVQQLDSAAAQLQSGGQSAPQGKGQAVAPPAPSAASASPLLGRVLGTTTSFVATAVEVVLLLWLLLASGDLFYEKMMRLLPVAADRRAAAKVANDTEAAVAGYLVATALINLGQAAAVGLAMWLIGMPDPMLWAVLTFTLERTGSLQDEVTVRVNTLATNNGQGRDAVANVDFTALSNVLVTFAPNQATQTVGVQSAGANRTISNSSAAAVTVTSVTSSAPTEFLVTGNGCTTVNAGANCTVTVGTPARSAAARDA